MMMMMMMMMMITIFPQCACMLAGTPLAGPEPAGVAAHDSHH
jgi:hypothetical protein